MHSTTSRAGPLRLRAAKNPRFLGGGIIRRRRAHDPPAACWTQTANSGPAHSTRWAAALTACLNGWPAVKRTTRRAAIAAAAPVLGLRPTRARLARTCHVPKRRTITGSPCRLSRNLAAPEYLCLVDVTDFCTDGDGVIAHVGSYTNNGRILLVIPLHSSRSTFSRGSFLSFFVFKESMLGTPISVIGG